MIFDLIVGQAVQQEQAAFHEAAKELLRSRVFLDRSAAYPLELIAHPRSTPLMVSFQFCCLLENAFDVGIASLCFPPANADNIRDIFRRCRCEKRPTRNCPVHCRQSTLQH
jgi:hypothetical protein